MPTTTLDCHTLFIPRWHPTPLNRLLAYHWAKRNRMKKNDQSIVATYAAHAGLPKATGKRRVSLEVVLGKRQRACDPDAHWKSLLDACVKCGLLVDDRKEYCELGTTTYRRDLDWGSVITLEEMP